MQGGTNQNHILNVECLRILQDFAEVFSRMAQGDYSVSTKLIGHGLSPEIAENISHSLNSIELRELERKCLEEEIARRDKILEAMSTACRTCMSADNLTENIDTLLRTIGMAVELQRIYILENPPPNQADIGIKNRYFEWRSDDYDPQTTQSRLVSFSWRDIERNQWEAFLSRSTDSPDENHPEMYGSHDLWSVLVFPVFVRKKYWGILGLETGHSITAWGKGEIEALEIVSHMLGQLVERDLDQIDKKLLQKNLEDARHLESLGILAGGVAHDLNNILGPMAAYPDLIGEHFDPDSSVRVELDTIKDSAIKASDIIQDLLTLSGNSKYEMTFLNLNNLADEYMNSVAFKYKLGKTSHVQIEQSFDNKLPSIYGSHSHIWKVIMNLVNNAVNSLPQGGKVTISTYTESNEENQDYVVLKVMYRGQNAKTRDILRIFDPLYSSPESAAENKGLGLAVAYRIVRDHEGLLQVENIPGEGSDISVHFPPRTSPEKALTTSPDSIIGTELILIIDDNPDQLMVASKTLGSLGYRVATAGSPEEALDMCRMKEYDLIVTDMILENKMNGLDLFYQIRQIRPAQKAIIVSGYSADERIQEAEEQGIQVFVRKPYTRDSIGRAVRMLLDKDTKQGLSKDRTQPIKIPTKIKP